LITALKITSKDIRRCKDIIAHVLRLVKGMKTIKKKPLTKKSTRLVISLFWFSIGCSPAGYLGRSESINDNNGIN
jgi:hypothetical protein